METVSLERLNVWTDMFVRVGVKNHKMESHLGISGLLYLKNFITVQEEQQLLALIDSQSWNTSLSRRTQHYGYIYDYNHKAASEVADPIPSWCDFVIDRMLEQKVLLQRPDQMIVNEYTPGQGIFPHVDSIDSFQDGIASLSLGSSIVMEFVHNRDRSNRKETVLEKRSVFSMHGDARYKWRHGIAARKTDNGVARGRRVSLTFRCMKQQNQSPTKRAKIEKNV